MSLLALWTARGVAQGPPVAPIRNVADTHFGVKVDDPYRYMEGGSDPDVAGWMKGQSAYARAVLDRIPGRASLLARMDDITRENAIAQGGANIGNVRRLPGDRYFYLKTHPPQDQTAKLYTRQGLNGREVLLVDPNVATMATGKPHVIDGYVPSFDGAYVAYGLSMSGAEDAVLHVIETATGKEIDRPIDRRPSVVNWRPDGRSFFYNRRQALTPGMAGTELKQRSQVFLHTIGQDAEKDPVVFGIDAPPPVGRINPPDIPTVITSPASRWALAIVRDSNDGGMSLYAAPIDAVAPGRIRWRAVAGDVKVGQLDHVAVHGDELFLITHSDALRRRVIKVNLAQADLNAATTVVPQGEAVIESIAASRDALYVVQRDGPMHQLLRVPLSGDPPRAKIVVPPAPGAIRLMPLDPRVDGALLSVGLPARVYAYDAAAGRMVDAGLLPRALETPTDCEIVYVKVPSHDGVLVPVSIVQRRGLQRNGSNPAILEGYGAYGRSLEANLRPPTRAWCELGGIYVFAHVRGGGEYGEEWYKAGYKATKPNTWKDAIAVAEYLIAEKYTSPTRLAIRGASAGGILVGRAITERPDLFAVALPSVGALDMIRLETTPNGVPNIAEFGSVQTEEGFKALHAMSAYHHVLDGTRYPAVLLQVGRNDPRVEPWQSAKMAARLQAATTSGKPVLFSMDDDAGHGGLASTRNQRQGNMADAMAFALWQFGAPKFQPTAGRAVVGASAP